MLKTEEEDVSYSSAGVPLRLKEKISMRATKDPGRRSQKKRKEKLYSEKKKGNVRPGEYTGGPP